MSTRCVFRAAGIQLTVRFTSPLLLDDPDVLSTPATFVDVSVKATDTADHTVRFSFTAFNELCFDGDTQPDLLRDGFAVSGMSLAYVGQRRQKLLCHSGDHITIDWGYLYLAGEEGAVEPAREGLCGFFTAALSKGGEQRRTFLLGYDDVASINYFGMPAKAWYARNGKTLPQALGEFYMNRDALLARCDALDQSLTEDALQRGGVDYAEICSAAYRQSVAAHKLIADEQGEMAFFSKENDSNGCIGTVDVSYPSAPLFLKYNPELVRAMCKPILRFAKMPVWPYDFAPHDVGRYPQATGQVYGAGRREAWGGKIRNGDLHPNYYLYPDAADVYELKYQMPVEECGNMLILLCAAAAFDGDFNIAGEDQALLKKWAQYLLQYGEDPGDQLCTDDFAGHLARNVNLSAKAIVGIACYARMLEAQGDAANAGKYHQKAKEMAESWRKRAMADDHTALTFDGQGWSMKYNLAWDRVLKLGLFDQAFYRRELASYLPRVQKYGLPLDSRASYTKSDWILWTASMAEDADSFHALIAPVAKYLRETKSRIPFGDWYDTKTGKYVHFIARSVQGGVFMPLL